jgi:hypothetical protein
VSQSSESKADAAEARTQETRGKGTLLIDWSGALSAMTGLGKRENPD